MKTIYRKFWLSLLMVMAVGVAKGATETYDFVKAAEGTTQAPTYGETVTSGGADLQLISVAGDSFNNRIAVGPTTRNDGTSNGFIFRTAGDWKGLWSQHDGRNFSILNFSTNGRYQVLRSQ